MCLLGLYIAMSAYYGFAVGRAIHVAETSSPMAAGVTTLFGRETIEQYAVLHIGVPPILVRGPVFWFTLRLAE